MKATDLKALAEQFRTVADSRAKVTELADRAVGSHPGDKDVEALVNRYRASTSADAVRAISDSVKNS